MNDIDAIVKYRSADRYLRIMDDLGPPAIPLSASLDKADQKAMDHCRQIYERSRQWPLQIIGQAERTVRALPRQEWREAFSLIYFAGTTVAEATDWMDYSERTLYNFLRRAFDYILAAEGGGRPKSGP